MSKPAFSIANLRAGLDACVKNALRLLATAERCVAASDSRLWQENHALGLSLAILALEEIGKFCLVDATLFSFEDDEVVKEVQRRHTHHKSKLDYLHRWPLIISHISTVSDPIQARALHLAGSIKKCQDITRQMESWIPGPDFAALDQWKQRGFYVSIDRDRIVGPAEAITRERAEQVVSFAHAVVEATAEHGLGNLDGYLEWAARQRDLLTPDTLNALRNLIGEAPNGDHPSVSE